MARITEYCVVSVNDVLKFSDGINMLISEGWQPFGSICVHPSNSERTISLFVQAMVKYDDIATLSTNRPDNFNEDI